MSKRALVYAAATLFAAVMMTGSAWAKPNTLDRSKIPDEYKWDLSQIYANWDAWQADLDKVKGMMDEYQQFKGTLNEGPEQILKSEQLSDSIGMIAYKIYQYPSLMYVSDTRDNSVMAKLQQVQILFAKFGQTTAWFTPELLTIPEDTMMAWIDRTPALQPYRFPLEETYRQQSHVLDEEGERLLAYSSQFKGTPQQTFTQLSVADVKFPTVVMSNGDSLKATNGNYEMVRNSYRDQMDREVMFKGHFSVYNDYENTYAAIYNGILQRDWFSAQARKYKSTAQAALDGDNIPVEVLDNLIATAKAGVAPLQKYQEIRKKVLGLDKYRYFDAYIPLVDADFTITWDQVKPMVIASVKVYGKQYQNDVKKALNNRWIDVYENEGKRSGAFSAGVYGVHPFMLLNYGDTMNDGFTIAHEMGHTMHTLLSQTHQPFATADYSIFVAEVASMTNEQFFLDYLLDHTKDPKKRIALLQHAIDDISGGFYRQAMFADYELNAHRAVEAGQPITAAALQKIYLKSLHDFFGDSMDDQDWYRNTWARIPHFFNSPYYVYKYATSKAAASLEHQMMTTGSKKQQKEAVQRYLTLLKSGGSDNPINLLKKAGVDFTTTEPIDALVTKMNTLVDRLEKELKDQGMLD